MHSPTESLRRNHNEDLLNATRELFDLNAVEDDTSDDV
jgi:hypothetical protein